MDNFKIKIMFKLDGIIAAGTVVLAGCSYVFKQQLLFSNWFFMLGLGLICLSIADILVHASLMSGWFQHKHKGETDEEYQTRKINVHQVAERKNRPLHYDRFSVNGSLIGGWLILWAVLLTI